MADANVTIEKGAKRPIYGSASLPGGTLTITTPAATCTLFLARVAVTGISAVAPTAQLAGPAEEVWVAYALDTAALAVGYYLMEFIFATTGSDGLARRFVVTVSIRIIDPLDG